MKAKRCLLGFLVAVMAFGGSTMALAKGAGGSHGSAGHSTMSPGKGTGIEEKTEKKGIEGKEHGKHKGELKKKNGKAKGTIERATPATPAVPTPHTPGATPAIPAVPSK